MLIIKEGKWTLAKFQEKPLAGYLFHLTMGIIHQKYWEFKELRQLHSSIHSFVCSSTKLDERAHYTCTVYYHYSLTGVNLIYLGYPADECVVFVSFINRTVTSPLPWLISLMRSIILHISWEIDKLCILHMRETLLALSWNVDFYL